MPRAKQKSADLSADQQTKHVRALLIALAIVVRVHKPGNPRATRQLT